MDRWIMSPLRGSATVGAVLCYNNDNPSGLIEIQKGLAELKELM